LIVYGAGTYLSLRAAACPIPRLLAALRASQRAGGEQEYARLVHGGHRGHRHP
jgi:hypothetical protein